MLALYPAKTRDFFKKEGEIILAEKNLYHTLVFDVFSICASEASTVFDVFIL